MKELNPDWPVFATTESYAGYELLTEMSPGIDTQGREYDMVDQTLENDDFYQGLNKITVIRRASDGKLFGYSWWDDISKHGQAYIEANGDEYGLECDTADDDFDWENDFVSYFVFEPVVESSLVIYKKEST